MNDQSPTARRVAVVGLGAMGYGMAQSLKRAGFQVAGCDVVGATVARFAAEGGRRRPIRPRRRAAPTSSSPW